MIYQHRHGFRGLQGFFALLCAFGALGTGAAFGQARILVDGTMLTFKAASGQNPPVQNVVVGSSGAALTLSATSSTTTGGNWLQYAFDSGTTPANLKVSPQSANLPGGFYQGQVLISASNAANSPLTINITLTVDGGSSTTLTAAPTVLNFSAQANGVAPPAQLITVGPADSNIGFTVAVSTGVTTAQWLQVTPVSGTTPQLLSVSVNPQGLTGGNYAGTVTIQPKAQGSGSASVVVNLAINTLPALIYTPQSVQFLFQTGTTTLPSIQGLTLSTTSGTLTMSLQATTGNGVPWLSVGQTTVIAGTIPVQIPISVSALITTFQPGSYSASILIIAPGATTPSVAIPITLQVSTLPLISLGNTPNPFSFRAGFPQPLPQSVQVGVSKGPLGFSAATVLQPGQTWLTVTPDSGTLPASLTLTVDAAGLSSGTYSGQVRVDASGAANTPLAIPISLTVSANGLLVVSPTELDYNFQVGMTAPAPQSLTIGTTGGNATYSVQTLTNGCGANWISATPISGSAPGVVKVTVNTTGMVAPGLCTGRVGLINQNGLQTLIPVNLTVSMEPLMNVTPPVLTFMGPANGAAPAVQTLQLSSTDVNNPLFYSALASTSNGGNWLSIANANTGQTPGTLQIVANQGNLISGSYSGVVEIRPTGLPPVRVPVTMVVMSNITLGVAPPSITFSAAAGSVPGPQLLNVSSQGGAVAFTVSAQSTQNWLSVTPTAGTTPGQLIVSADPTGLPPATYDGSLTIASNQTSNPALTVPVRLVVGQAQTLAVTPLSLLFNSTVGDVAPASQMITLTPSAGTVDFKVTAEFTGSVPWLTLTPSGGTAPLSLTVTVDPTNLAPAVYGATITITPKGLPQVVIPVSYAFAPPPLPSLSAAVNLASLQDGPVAPGEIVVLKGSNTGFSGDLVLAQRNADGSLPMSIGDTQVLFDTYFAPILSVETNQVTVVVPYEIAGQPSTLIQVKRKSVYSNLLQIPVASAAMGVFTKPVPTGMIGVILNADGTANSDKNPALVNTVLTVYYTGDGQTNPPTTTNSVYPATGTQAMPVLPMTATIGGVMAPVSSFGPVPGSFAGLSTAAVTVPATLGPGMQPLFMITDASTSQAGVFVYVTN